MTRLAPRTPTSSTLSLALLAVVTASPALAQSADAPPSKPGNARTALYPGAGGELFWQRSTDDRGVRGYEITRNGTSLGIRDALSYYDPSLRANTAYTFTITAIDTAGQRSAVATATLGGGATNPMPPTAPPGDGPIRTGATELGGEIPVRLAVYDAQSFELFWQRVPGAVTYRLQRDGRTVQESTGVSHYVSGVDTRATFAYALVALGSSGNALRTTRFTVQPAAGTQLVAGNGSPNPIAGPVAPQNARLQVYSSTAAELFWTRAPATDRVTGTEVRRDGRVIGNAPGNSFFDDTRAPGRSYRYELTAVSASGARSATTVLGGDTGNAPPVGGTALFAPDSAVDGLLPRLFLALRATQIEAFVDSIAVTPPPRFEPERPVPGLTLVGRTTDGNTATDTLRYRCDQGGTTTLVSNGTADNNARFRFDACVVGGLTHDGGYALLASSGVRRVELDPSLNLLAQGTSATASGSRTRSDGLAVPAGELRYDVSDYDATNGVIFESISNYRTVVSYNDQPSEGVAPYRRFTTSFTINARWTGGEDVDVRTEETFDDFADGNYQRGTLVATAGDGSSLRLSAGNGDPSSFQLDLSGNGATDSRTLDWDAVYRLPCIARPPSTDRSPTAEGCLTD